MSRFRLKGSYTESYSATDIAGAVEVTVPLISQAGKLNWGMDTMLGNLCRSGIYPTEDGMDLLCLATLVYLADTRISREFHSQNS